MISTGQWLRNYLLEWREWNWRSTQKRSGNMKKLDVLAYERSEDSSVLTGVPCSSNGVVRRWFVLDNIGIFLDFPRKFSICPISLPQTISTFPSLPSTSQFIFSFFHVKSFFTSLMVRKKSWISEPPVYNNIGYWEVKWGALHVLLNWT